MKRQLTNFEIVMGIVLAAALIGFAIVVNPFRSQELSEGLTLPSINSTTGQSVETGSVGAIDAAKWGPEDLEAHYIYSRGYPVPRVQNGFSNASNDALEAYFSAESGAGDLEAFMSGENALAKTPASLIEAHKARWAAAGTESAEPSLPYWVKQYMEADEAAAGVEAKEPALPYWVKQYVDIEEQVANTTASDPTLPYWVKQYIDPQESEVAEPPLPYWVKQYMDEGQGP